MKEIKYRYVFRSKYDGGWGKELRIAIYTIEQIERGNVDFITNDNWELLARDQYTGLHDKNNQEIYNGDIVTADNNYTMDKKSHYEVCWFHFGWALSLIRLDSGPRYTYPYATHPERYDGLEIIGNIHKNLETKKSICKICGKDLVDTFETGNPDGNYTCLDCL